MLPNLSTKYYVTNQDERKKIVAAKQHRFGNQPMLGANRIPRFSHKVSPRRGERSDHYSSHGEPRNAACRYYQQSPKPW